jgi:hypothetical protein
METMRDTVPVPLDKDLTVLSPPEDNQGIPRDGFDRESLPLRSEFSAEVQRERDLYIRGIHCLNDNDVACARLYFRLGAERFRSGRSAIAMGDTFNPRRLKERKIYGGVQADIVESLRWYEWARELLPSEATQRLHELQMFGNGS